MVHALGVHRGLPERVPAVQEYGPPVKVYPALQVGWHVDPDGSGEESHVPIVPCVGGVTAHALGVH